MSFFSIFLPLFVIASVVFLIRVSTITSIIEVNLFEMFKLYLFIIPDLLFYTLPLSFFIGGVVAFNRLSFDSEMVVIFSLGIAPSVLLKILFKISIFITILLIFISIVMIPHTKQMYKEFVKYKQQEAVLNIKATEFGQEFGDWSIFIESIEEFKNEKVYKNVALFYKNGDIEERFIVSNRAYIKNSNGVVQLYLYNGSLFTYKRNKIRKIFFKEMKINDLTSINNFKYLTTLEYLQYSLENDKRREKLISALILATFPLLSIFLILSIGIQNMRYGKSLINILIGITILIFYMSAFALSKKIDFYAFAFIPLWFIFTYIIYNRKISSQY
jgi:lipopolysaccharide export system permease protein